MKRRSEQEIDREVDGDSLERCGEALARRVLALLFLSSCLLVRK